MDGNTQQTNVRPKPDKLSDEEYRTQMASIVGLVGPVLPCRVCNWPHQLGCGCARCGERHADMN